MPACCYGGKSAALDPFGPGPGNFGEQATGKNCQRLQTFRCRRSQTMLPAPHSHPRLRLPGNRVAVLPYGLAHLAPTGPLVAYVVDDIRVRACSVVASMHDLVCPELRERRAAAVCTELPGTGTRRCTRGQASKTAHTAGDWFWSGSKLAGFIKLSKRELFQQILNQLHSETLHWQNQGSQQPLLGPLPHRQAYRQNLQMPPESHSLRSSFQTRRI